jgi:limonene-1,2-epoxide hydrolase
MHGAVYELRFSLVYSILKIPSGDPSQKSTRIQTRQYTGGSFLQLADTIEQVPVDSENLACMVKEVFENLDPSQLDQLRKLYATDVCFEDPLQGIQGLDALISRFEKMYSNIEHCRFKFHHSIVSSDGLFLSWTMLIRHRLINKAELIHVEGASYLKHRNGRIYYHRDYFDLGAMVYENVPILGLFIHSIRGRASR